MLETAVTLTSPVSRSGVDLVEIVNDGTDRCVQAVEIQPIKACLVVRMGVVVVPQPAHEVLDDGVAPHPVGKAAEIVERIERCSIVVCIAHVAIDAEGVWPVGFGSNRTEPAFLNEPTSDSGALTVELLRAMTRLADQDEAGVADLVQQAIVVPRFAAQGLRVECNGVRSTWGMSVNSLGMMGLCHCEALLSGRTITAFPAPRISLMRVTCPPRIWQAPPACLVRRAKDAASLGTWREARATSPGQ